MQNSKEGLSIQQKIVMRLSLTNLEEIYIHQLYIQWEPP